MAVGLAVSSGVINRNRRMGDLHEGAMLIYRYLTGEDDSAFCHKVTKALSEGWTLHGSPSYAFDGAAMKMKCGQAVTREASDQPYDPDKKLVDYV